MTERTTGIERRRNRSGTILVLAGALCAATVSSCSQPAGAKKKARAAKGANITASSNGVAESSAGEEAVLRVGSESVSAAELVPLVRSEIARATGVSGIRPPIGVAAEAAGRVLRDRVGEMLLYQEAAAAVTKQAEAGLSAFVDARIREVVSLEHDGVQRRYERYLEENGSSIEKERERIRRRLIIDTHLEEAIRPAIEEPTRAQLVAEFERWKQRAEASPEKRRMSLIDIRVERFLPGGVTAPSAAEHTAAREEARSVAMQALSSIRGGREFAEVAREVSHGLRASTGGVWPMIGREDVREKYQPAADALFSLPIGEVSEPIETDEGFFLVRCDEIDGPATESFVEAQPELRESLMQARFMELVTESIEKLRRKRNVTDFDLEVFHRDLVRAVMNDYDAGN